MTHNNDSHNNNVPEITDEEMSSAEMPDALSALQEELQHTKDQWMRAVAESENIRRRGQKEKEEAIRYGALSFARDMVSIIDNLKRAMGSCADEEMAHLPSSVQSLITGLSMIIKEIDTTLTRHHIQCISPSLEPFNAHLHQAMFEIESVEHEPLTVLQVVQEGYVLHDRLIRPALVGVSKRNTPSVDSEQKAQE